MPSLVINAVIVAGSLFAWCSIVVGGGDDRTLALQGWRSLKYYTVLSNLLSAFASAAYLFGSLLPRVAASSALLTLKLAGASTVTVTFLVTAFVLTPAFGWRILYQGGNFWLHLVLPVLAVADVCLFAPVGTLPLPATLAAVAFTALYAVFYARPVLKYGPEHNGHVYDFYGFCRWGKDKLWIVALAALLMTWAIAVVLRAVSALVCA